MYKILDSLKKN